MIIQALTPMLINSDKRTRLREMNIFVLDNSLRETTVGQPVGHSLGDKFKILSANKECGFHHQVAGAFSTGERVDDVFSGELKKAAEKRPDSVFYAFSEVFLHLKDGCMCTGEDDIPTGLQKMKEYGIPNAIIEIDIAYDKIDWNGKFPVSKLIEHLTFLLKWSHENLSEPTGVDRRMIFINLRDFPVAMLKCPERVLEIVRGISRMPPAYRPAGLMEEEPMGEYFPEEVAAMVKAVRDTMDANGWPSLFQQDGSLDGMILSHVHKQWGLADAVALDSLAAGADGIWCAICEEGAAYGHASSCVTLMNLVRLGNKDVLSRYNPKNFIKAARDVTAITTNKRVPSAHIVYGPRALDTVFGFGGIAGGVQDDTFDKDANGVIDDVDRFTLASFLGLCDPPVRISTLASPQLVVQRLEQCFGSDPDFNKEIASKMMDTIKQNLISNLEAEYTSSIGLASLWRQVTGTLHPSMQKIYDSKREGVSEQHEILLKTAKDYFGQYLEAGNDSISYESFKEAYLCTFFDRFEHMDIDYEFVFDSLFDVDKNNGLSWTEMKFWYVFVLREYPNEINTFNELQEVVLRSALLPTSLRSPGNTNE